MPQWGGQALQLSQSPSVNQQQMDREHDVKVLF